MTDLIKTAKELIELAERSDSVWFKKDAHSWRTGPIKPDDITALCRLLLVYHEAIKKLDGFCLKSIHNYSVSDTHYKMIDLLNKALAAAVKGGEAG